MRKILIVGGAGYIGGYLADILKKSSDVMIYDALLYEDVYLKPCSLITGDVRDHSLLKLYLDWADIVIWLAAIVGDPACAANPKLAGEINRDAVKFLRDNFDGHIIFASTCSVYGASDDLLTEFSPTNPLSVYAKTKLEAEKILGVGETTIFRLGTLFGVGDHFSRIRMDLAVNRLTYEAYAVGNIFVYGGEQWRPFLHVRDAAMYMALAVEGELCGLYNLAHVNMKIIELANSIKDKVKHLKITIQDVMFQDHRNYRVDHSLAETEFKFQALRNIKDGIEEIRDLCKDGRIRNVDSPRFNNAMHMEAQGERR